jgi:hypothetical protein
MIAVADHPTPLDDGPERRPAVRDRLAARKHRAVHRPPPSNWVIVYLLIVVALLLGGLLVSLSGKQDDGRAAGDQGRAVNCQIAYDLGENIDNFPACNQPGVRPLIDTTHPPTAGASSPGQQRNLALLCHTLAALNQPDDTCRGVGTTTTR